MSILYRFYVKSKCTPSINNNVHVLTKEIPTSHCITPAVMKVISEYVTIVVNVSI